MSVAEIAETRERVVGRVLLIAEDAVVGITARRRGSGFHGAKSLAKVRFLKNFPMFHPVSLLRPKILCFGHSGIT